MTLFRFSRRSGLRFAAPFACALCFFTLSFLAPARSAPGFGGSAALGGDIEPPTMPDIARVQPPRFAGGTETPSAEDGSVPSVERSLNTTSGAVVAPDMGAIRRVRVGGDLLSDAPMRVGNVDVLAPVLTRLSKVGARLAPVSPSEIPGNLNTPTQERYFKITPAVGAPIIMVVGRAAAYVNGEERALRAAPLFINEKIYLPVYSLAPLLGAATRLESDGTLNLNPTIQSATLFPFRNTVALLVKASAPLPKNAVLMGTMESPPRLYLDFPGFSMGFDATGNTEQRTVANGLGVVKNVRAGLFQKFPDTTRLALDLTRITGGVAAPSDDPTTFMLVLTSSLLDRIPPGPEPTTKPPIFDPRRPLAGWTIVVDPGHGGHDSGARGARSNEKTHNLDIARRLSARLRELGANAPMTRDSDNFVTLQGRCDFANVRRADLFVSVHVNASVKPSVGGTETYYWNAPSLWLAREVHAQLSRATGLKNNGVKRARFYVIRNTEMPAVLTETAFVSNANEERKLLLPSFRQQVAWGIARGIVNYAAKTSRR